MKWNNQVKLIISDVDETIADNYTPATPEMIKELSSVLEEGKALFLVTGASITRMRSRIIDALPAHLRKQIICAHCSGAEIWGFNTDGTQKKEPFFSLYDSSVSDEQKKIWRNKVEQLLQEFQLKLYPPVPIMEFKKRAGNNPLAIMMEDRGPQITFELPNAFELNPDQANSLAIKIPETHGNYDLRIPILERAEVLFTETNLPITPRLAGIWAIDFAIKGINKTTAVKHLLDDEEILKWIGLTKQDLQNPQSLEIWGDRFSSIRGGTDRHLCEALPKEVRAIDFREENREEFLDGYNIVLWDGKDHMQNGLLEYLKTRHQ
jgi:hydroxymethylpyrimidine pyrophosphatase-like HAD family hydrolase